MTTDETPEEKNITVCVVCDTGKYGHWATPKQLCEEHDVCVSCGIKRSHITESPWAVRNGAFQCKPCEKIERDKRIKDRKNTGFDHEYTDEVICPHCGYEHADSWDMRDGGVYDCPDCDGEFELEHHVSVSYTTTPKPQVQDKGE